MFVGKSPGKLIISGEHAVVYGNPALAVAIDRYVTTTLTDQDSPEITVHAPCIGPQATTHISLEALTGLYEKIQSKHRQFLKGELSIEQVLSSPTELMLATLAASCRYFKRTLKKGLKLTIDSTLPIGCGLGSSAAAIHSVLEAITAYLGDELPGASQVELASELENFQHGRSSSLDVRVTHIKGGVLFSEGKVIKRMFRSTKLAVVNTGNPLSTTGECVQHSKAKLQNEKLLAHFAKATNMIDQALQARDQQALANGIRLNQRLLDELGVIPSTVQDFINKIEGVGGSAKVCGAGSIRGEQAGCVLLHWPSEVDEQEQTEIPQQIQQICSAFGYEVEELRVVEAC